MEAAHLLHMSEDEYLSFERSSETKHEYANGQIIDMAGASTRHNLIVANVLAALGNRLRGGPCFALASDQRVSVANTALYSYPDVTVVCGSPKFHPKAPATILNPT